MIMTSCNDLLSWIRNECSEIYYYGYGWESGNYVPYYYEVNDRVAYDYWVSEMEKCSEMPIDPSSIPLPSGWPEEAGDYCIDPSIDPPIFAICYLLLRFAYSYYDGSEGGTPMLYVTLNWDLMMRYIPSELPCDSGLGNLQQCLGGYLGWYGCSGESSTCDCCTCGCAC
jgi:hypothetical protein